MARKIGPERPKEPGGLEELRVRRVVGISEFKKNPMRVFVEAKGETFAVLNFNRPEFYIVPAPNYGALLDRIAELERAAMQAEGEERTRMGLSP
ncbi:MAG: antitoxin [Parvibaculum sp.]|uniref:antitoxin n=1 Tax=Parvibaculum sp. TaxID=2024848 RepID=UPI0032664788